MVLNELIIDQLLTQEARRLKLEPTDAEVDAELATYRKRASSSRPVAGRAPQAVRAAARRGRSRASVASSCSRS